MDVSQEYVNMCEKATKIQSHKTEFMDWYVCRTHHRVLEPDGMYYSEYGCPDSSIDPKSLIWLPLQSQLQEMVREVVTERYGRMGDSCNEVLLDRFYDWSKYTHRYVPALNLNPVQATTSMEQLWLAFVMKEKYNKVWNGKDWIPAEQPSAAR